MCLSDIKYVVLSIQNSVVSSVNEHIHIFTYFRIFKEKHVTDQGLCASDLS